MHPIIEQEMVRQQQAGLARDEGRQELMAEARANRESAANESGANESGAHESGAGAGSAHEPALHHLVELILHPRTPHDPAH
jgi:hypothetical protein